MTTHVDDLDDDEETKKNPPKEEGMRAKNGVRLFGMVRAVIKKRGRVKGIKFLLFLHVGWRKS